jgi:hypothetical protein
MPAGVQAAFSDFRSIAAELCAIVDTAPSLDRVVMLSRLYGILPRLIHQAIELPRVSCSDGDTRIEIRKARMKTGDWDRLYQLLKERLGDWNLYWQVFDPTKDSEAIHGSLADDIADIYRDLNDGLGFENPDLALQRDAVWSWRFGFYSHWGKHAIDALRTIHFLLEDKLS